MQVQLVLPASENMLLGHLEHVLFDVAALAFEYVPAGQVVQDRSPGLDLYVPCAHEIQTFSSLSVYPAMQLQ